jgi:protease-4
MLTSGLWDKIGLSWDEVHAGANARMWTGTHDYSPSEWARFQAFLDRIYSDFTTKVSEGRRLPKETVLQIAKGRIWSGEDAKTLGLVDELGGFPVALRLAKEAAGIPESEEVRLQLFPPKKTTFDVIFGEKADNSERAGLSAALVRALKVIQPLARQIRALGAETNRGVVAMPEVPTRH